MNKDTKASNASVIDPYTVPFFHDFILFLKRLEQKPIRKTKAGNISLTDIQDFLTQCKQQERIEEFKKYGWSLRREEELDFLTQIKIIAGVMYLTYNRKDYLKLSKSGRGFLHNIDSTMQYSAMVLHYWYRVNWGYFTFGREIQGKSIESILQNNQTIIWKALLEKGSYWHDYRTFCFSLRDYFNLHKHVADEHDEEYELLSEIHHVLFRKNLLRFGCVEAEEKKYKYDWHTEISRFRPTELGLRVFHKAVCENYLGK